MCAANAMNNQQPKNSETRWPLATFLSKAVALLLCAWVAWQGLAAMRALLATESGGPSLIQQVRATSPLEVAPWLSRQSEGYWSFAGWQWRVGVREVSDERLPEVMAQQLARELSLPGPAEAGELRFLEVLRRLGSSVRADAAGETLSSETTDLRWQVRVCQHNGERRLASGVLAMRAGAQTWQVWELTRADETPAEVTRGQLLPYGDDATQLASRSTDAGELMFELVGLSGMTTTSDLLRGWRGAGWQVEPLPASPMAFGSLGFHYLCTRGQDRVVVWSAGGGHRPASLIAARLAESDSVSTPIRQASTR